MNLRATIHSSAFGICSRLPWWPMRRSLEHYLLHPFYHAVSDRRLPHVARLYRARTVRQFETELDFFLGISKPLSLDELSHRRNNNEPIGKGRFMISFDDGLRECAEVIAPILKRKGVPATFFIVPSTVDNKTMLYRHKCSLLVEALCENSQPVVVDAISKILNVTPRSPARLAMVILSKAIQYSDAVLSQIAAIVEVNFEDYLLRQAPYMNASEILGLIRDGFTVGGHSLTHPHFSELSIDQQLVESIESVRLIKRQFNLSYGVFAFPFSDRGVRPEYFARLKEEGTVQTTFGTRGICRLPSDFSAIQRFPMEGALSDVGRIVAGQYYLDRLKSLWRK